MAIHLQTLPYTDLVEVEAELVALRELEADWDGEDALPIEDQVVTLAIEFTKGVASSAELKGYVWQRPEIAPMRSGGVSLSWHLLDNMVVVFLQPQDEKVVLVTKESQALPVRQVLSTDDAIDAILQALRNTSSSI